MGEFVPCKPDCIICEAYRRTRELCKKHHNVNEHMTDNEILSRAAMIKRNRMYKILGDPNKGIHVSDGPGWIRGQLKNG